MAHVGKRYPVAFRRDVSLNKTSTDQYFPRSLKLQISSASGTLGSFIDTHPLRRLDESGDHLQPYIVWGDEFKSFGGRLIRCLVTLDKGATEYFRFRAQILDSVLGQLAFQEVEFYDVPDGEGFSFDRWSAQPPPYPAVLGCFDRITIAHWTAETWSAFP